MNRQPNVREAFFAACAKKAPRTPKEIPLFSASGRKRTFAEQLPPKPERGRPRTSVGYGRHTGPGARPFRYVAAVAGLVTGRGLTLSGKAKSRIISGDTPPNSRYVTIRAGQKPTKSYEPRKCAEDNVAVKAAIVRLRSVSHRPQRKAIFLSGHGGLSFDKTKESPPNIRLPVRTGKSPGGKPPRLPTRSLVSSPGIARSPGGHVP